MFGTLGNITNLVKQAKEMGSRLETLGDELRSKRVTGAGGGGMVEIDMNGLQDPLECRIDPKVFETGDRELIEDLVCEAVKNATAKARELHATAMKSMTGGIEIPGLQDALSKLGTGAS